MTAQTKVSLRELEKAATPAPWAAVEAKDRGVRIEGGRNRLVYDGDLPFGLSATDSELIAAMRNALPLLLDLVESIKWVPMEFEDDDEPSEFAVADPDAYRRALAALDAAQ